MMADGPTQHHRVKVWQSYYLKIADLLVVFFKNWQAGVTWEIRVTSKDILSKKSSQNDFLQLTLWLLSLSSRDIPFNEIPNLRLIFQNNNNTTTTTTTNNNNLNIFIQDCYISFNISIYQCTCCKKLKLKIKKNKNMDADQITIIIK